VERLHGSSLLQQTATGCNRLQQAATGCNRLQQTAIDCNRLEQTATHIDTASHESWPPCHVTRLLQVTHFHCVCACVCMCLYVRVCVCVCVVCVCIELENIPQTKPEGFEHYAMAAYSSPKHITVKSEKSIIIMKIDLQISWKQPCFPSVGFIRDGLLPTSPNGERKGGEMGGWYDEKERRRERTREGERARRRESNRARESKRERESKRASERERTRDKTRAGARANSLAIAAGVFPYTAFCLADSEVSLMGWL